MRDRSHESPPLAREQLAARAALDLTTAIALVSRAVRAQRGESQRATAARRGWSVARTARSETDAGSLRLADVLTILDESPFDLAVVRDGEVVPAESWSCAELLARDEGGRRLPAHHTISRVDRVAATWWYTRHGWGVDEPLWTWFRRYPDDDPPTAA